VKETLRVSECIYQEGILSTRRKLTVTTAYDKLPRLFDRFGSLSNEDFLVLNNPNNYIAQIILGHLFMVDHVISELLLKDQPIQTSMMQSSDVTPRALIAWLEKIADGLPSEHQKFIAWPLNFAREVISRGKPALSLQAWYKASPRRS
jgi:hypothetical protein